MPKFTDESIAAIFGNEDAENEAPERLKQFFFRNKAYESLGADLPIRIIVGHKGVGKSALLKMCHFEDLDNDVVSLWVRPNDVFGAVDSQADRFVDLIENWKSGISTLLVKSLLEGAGDYEEAGQVRKIKGGIRQAASIIADYFLNNNKRLSGEAAKIAHQYKTNKKIRVYLDDLDRGWQARPEDIANISALLNAVRDMAGQNRDIQFRIGLRTDVYYLVRTADESTDKIEANLIWLTWSNHDILVAMAKRVSTFFGDTIDEASLGKKSQREVAAKLNKVMEPTFSSRGHWENAPTHRVLLSLTRKRPRDLVKLFTYSAKEAHRNDSEIIRTGHIEAIFEKYSNERLRDIVNEFKSELRDVETLLLQMRQTKKEREAGIGPVFTQDQLFKKIQGILYSSRLSFTSGQPATPQTLAQFLYKTDFITARLQNNDGKIVRKHFEENQSLQQRYADFGFKWEIHPAYRWALRPQSLDEILKKIDLVDLEIDDNWVDEN
jgi:hypothetical protein